MNFEDLNLDNVIQIKEGMIFKNRRDLFNFLGVEYIKDGKKAQNQLKKVDMIFEYSKKGHKFIVERTKDLSQIELSFRLTNDRQTKIAQLLILDLIMGGIRHNKEAVIINKNVLIPYLALANQNYIYYYMNKNNELAKKLNIKENQIKTLDSWLNSVRSTLKCSINGAISELKKEGLIMHNEVLKVKAIDVMNNKTHSEEVMLYRDGENNESDYSPSMEDGMRLATDTETNEIMDIEKEVLRDMKTTKKELFLKRQYDEFNRKCNQKTLERLGIELYFFCHKFNYAKSFIEEKKIELIEQIQKENIDDLKYELNSLLCSRVRENSQKRLNNHKEIIEKGVDMSLFDEQLVGFSKENSEKKRRRERMLKMYENELSKSYMNTSEHKEIEERLVSFLLEIEDLSKDVNKVWFDKIIDN